MCVAVKKCSFCNINYPISLFRKDKNKKTTRSRCKLCENGLSRERRRGKPKTEAKKQQEKEWYLKNKRKRKEYLSEWYLNNKNEVREYSKQRYLKKELSKNKHTNVSIKKCPKC